MICTHTPSRVSPTIHWLQDSYFIDKGHPRKAVDKLKSCNAGGEKALPEIKITEC